MTPLEHAVSEGHDDIVYYLRKICYQDISLFLVDFQSSINITIKQYKRTHPKAKIQSLQVSDHNVRTGCIEQLHPIVACFCCSVDKINCNCATTC